MLFEDHCGRQRRFQTMRGAMPDDSAKAAQRLAASLVVVWQGVQPALDGQRGRQTVDDPALGGSEQELRRRRRVSAREREPL